MNLHDIPRETVGPRLFWGGSSRPCINARHPREGPATEQGNHHVCAQQIFNMNTVYCECPQCFTVNRYDFHYTPTPSTLYAGGLWTCHYCAKDMHPQIGEYSI